MSNENINFIRDNFAPVTDEERAGYVKALQDIVRVSENIASYGSYVEEEVRDLTLKLAKAQRVPFKAYT